MLKCFAESEIQIFHQQNREGVLLGGGPLAFELATLKWVFHFQCVNNPKA